MPQQPPKKVVKRPVRQARQERSRATVASIVEAATRILAEDGWRALNTNAIADRAGVSVGSVYEYFPDKQAILDVIIERHLAAGEKRLDEAASELAGQIRPDRLVEALVSGFIGLHSDDPRLHRALSSEVPISPAQRRRVAALREKIIELVTQVLSQHIADAPLKATLLVDTADALAHRWFIDEVGLPLSADLMAAEATRMLRGYVLS